MNKLPDWFRKTLIILFWLLLWQGLSLAVRNQIFLVGPIETFRALSAQITSAAFWKAIGFSFGRISLGFFLAFAAGLLTGSLASFFPFFGELLSPAVQFMKSIPVASFVILALIWTGSENLSVFIAFLVVFPVIHVNTIAGIQSTDKKLLEMAFVFRIPPVKKALTIYRTALYPYLKSACKTALGMGFKSGIAAEVIGVPDGSIGEGLYMAKIYLSTAELFAWTVTIIVLSTLFEILFLFLMKLLAGKGVPEHDGKSEKAQRAFLPGRNLPGTRL